MSRTMLSVPRILQNPELPNGCEITSLCEVLHFYGIPADKVDLADNYLPCSKEWYGTDPNRFYMGNPHIDDGTRADCGYYCFAGPIIAAADTYLTRTGLRDRFEIEDLTGSEPQKIEEEIRLGHPVIFWASLHFQDIKHDEAVYPLSDGSLHHVFHELHCMVAKGVGAGKIHLADPLGFNESVDEQQFAKIYRQLGKRAVVLRRKEETIMNPDVMTKEDLAGMFDHTNLKAFAEPKDFEKLCAEAAENHFASVAINSAQAALCTKLLVGSGVKVCTAISFPLGQMTIEGKVFEAEDSIKNGATEVDYVLNVGALKSGNLALIEEEMRAITEACHKGGALVKVIFENCYLTKDEIRTAAEIAKKVKPDFIKTSTGFGTGGATVEDVKLMKDTVGSEVKVKAAGGIRTWKDCREMILAGAERIGTSGGIKILAEFCAERGIQ